jgi:hypothetical protein
MMTMTKTSIEPDGVPIEVAWEKFSIGASVFIPCMNTVKASQQVKYVTAHMDMLVQVTTRAENNKWGIRVWRTM